MGTICGKDSFTEEDKKAMDVKFEYGFITISGLSLVYTMLVFTGILVDFYGDEMKLHSKNMPMFLIVTIWPIICLAFHSMEAVKHPGDNLEKVSDQFEVFSLIIVLTAYWIYSSRLLVVIKETSKVQGRRTVKKTIK